MQITKRSMLSGKTYTKEIDISEEQMRKWQSGTPIQNACPHLSVGDREFLISGSTEEEWEQYFGKKGNV